MYSKLAFAITAILETDITLIDEVLSVGDAQFKEKSYNKMKELISDESRTVIIVSHSLGTIKELCDELGYASNMKDYKENPEKYKGNVSDVSNVIRVALTGRQMSPDMYEIMQVAEFF